MTSSKTPHVTTYKINPRIGGGMRIMAALEGTSIADFGQKSVVKILDYHGRPAVAITSKTGTGRPSPTLEQAARTVADLRPQRNDTIPTRIAKKTNAELERLADELGTRMNYLAEEGAIHLLKRSPRFVKALSGLSTEEAYEEAIAVVREVAEGHSPEQRIRDLAAEPVRKSKRGTGPRKPATSARKQALSA